MQIKNKPSSDWNPDAQVHMRQKSVNSAVNLSPNNVTKLTSLRIFIYVIIEPINSKLFILQVTTKSTADLGWRNRLLQKSFRVNEFILQYRTLETRSMLSAAHAAMSDNSRFSAL